MRPDPRAGFTLRCRCIWDAGRCSNDATKEDGLCDWCGTRRPEDLKNNPAAIFDLETGEFLALGGGREMHVDALRTPDVCWMPGSGRELADD